MTPYLRQSLAFEPTSIEIGLLSSQQQNEFITDSSNLHHLSIDGSFLKSTFGAHNYVMIFPQKAKKDSPSNSNGSLHSFTRWGDGNCKNKTVCSNLALIRISLLRFIIVLQPICIFFDLHFQVNIKNESHFKIRVLYIFQF